jgi:hypothetical protein
VFTFPTRGSHGHAGIQGSGARGAGEDRDPEDVLVCPVGHPRRGYRVNADATECSCDDFELRQKPCKHIYAVRFVKERIRGKPLPESKGDTDATAPTPRPTYKQDWPAYNAAQTHEKELFLKLLADLCGGIEWMPRGGRGRPCVPYPDAIFAAVFKVYSTFSGRRFQTDLRNARDAGHVAVAPHYNSAFRVLEDPTVTQTLRQLVIRSSLPLRVVETTFAADSTGVQHEQVRPVVR